MIMINGNWEQVKELSDVLRIVSENIGDEFAQKVEEIFKESSLELEEQNFMLKDKNENLKNKQNEIEELFIEVLNLAEDMLESDGYEKYIDELNSIIDGEI